MRALQYSHQTSKYALHAATQQHTFGNLQECMQILHTHNKDAHLNTIERFYIFKKASTNNHLNDNHTIPNSKIFHKDITIQEDKKNIQPQPHNICSTHGLKSLNFTKLKILHLKACFACRTTRKLITQKSQTATRPADPEEAPSKPMSEPTPEHPVGHPNVPKQKDTSQNSADPHCFSLFQCHFLF